MEDQIAAPTRHAPDATFTQTALSDQQILALQEFVAEVASAKHESESDGGIPWEDACATINEWIDAARELTTQPGHPKLFCVKCQTSIDECMCEEGGDD